jgi:hydroxymethylglutaryl-CoA synthase
VAMLIGPNAPIFFEPGMCGSYMQHAYDFYKSDMTSEYPLVDGHFSIKCYTETLDACYKAYNKREAALRKSMNGSAPKTKTGLDRFDYMSFHAPTCKLVSKSYARMLYNDYLLDPFALGFADLPADIKDMLYEKSFSDKVVEKTFMGLAKKKFQELSLLASLKVLAFITLI